jgi:PhnB protein
MAVRPVPEGYHSVTPYLAVQGVHTLLDFLKQAFDATEIFRIPGRMAPSCMPRSGSATRS